VSDLTERINDAQWAHDLDCDLVRDAHDENGAPGRPCSCPIPALLREAAEQLAAKDAEIERLTALGARNHRAYLSAIGLTDEQVNTEMSR
jgi:hypothetical protein